MSQMRELGSYSAAEWLALSPVVHRFKYLRNRALERAYRNLGAAARDRFLDETAPGLSRTLAVTVAFNTPWVVDLFLRLARLNLPEASVIVADNSSKRPAQAEISGLCGRHGAAYVRLPRNPEWHPNRSHGIALNWAYYNLVKPLDPAVFAFFDHDLLALSRFDIADAVSRQPAYGLKKQHPGQEAWSLWAGYAIFNNAAIKGRDLDFNYDQPLRLDTGGYNWGRLYRFLDENEMAFAARDRVWFRDPDDDSRHACDLVDSFAHVKGVSHTSRGKDPQRIAIFRRLVAHIETGGRWQDQVLPP